MKVFISLTTTHARLGLIYYALQSLRRQKYDEFQIVVNLSREPYLFDIGIAHVPEWMRGGNISVRFVKNSGPYRKLLPLINEIDENDLIVTADDDVLYGEEWLARMVDRAVLHSESIVCGRARRIKKNAFGLLQNYAKWPLVSDPQYGVELVPIGCSGVAYRKSLLDLSFLNDEAYFDLAPTADDVWFRISSLRKGVDVFVDPDIDGGSVYMRHGMGLWEENFYIEKENKSPIMWIAQRLSIELKDYLGVPLGRNDRSWRDSISYSNNRKY